MDDTNPEIESTNADIAKYGALRDLSETPGGKELLKVLEADMAADVGVISSQYATISESELRARCASLSKSLNLIRAIKRAGDNYSGAVDHLKFLTQ